MASRELKRSDVSKAAAKLAEDLTRSRSGRGRLSVAQLATTRAVNEAMRRLAFPVEKLGPASEDPKIEYRIQHGANTGTAPGRVDVLNEKLLAGRSLGSPVTAVGDVQQGVSALVRAIDRMEETIMDLASRLQPVLRDNPPAPPGTMPSDIDPPQSTAIGSEVIDQARRARSLRNRLGEIIDRLGV